jgi:hypothetical protein
VHAAAVNRLRAPGGGRETASPHAGSPVPRRTLSFPLACRGAAQFRRPKEKRPPMDRQAFATRRCRRRRRRKRSVRSDEGQEASIVSVTAIASQPNRNATDARDDEDEAARRPASGRHGDAKAAYQTGRGHRRGGEACHRAIVALHLNQAQIGGRPGRAIDAPPLGRSLSDEFCRIARCRRR